MKNLIIILAFSLLTIGAYAQQNILYNHFYIEPALYNPAAIGIGDQVNAFLLHKQYLTGFDGNPTSNFLHLSGSLKENKMGVGLNVFTDRIGVSNKFGFQGAYSYRAKFGNEHDLSFGASLGLLQFSIDPDAISVENAADPLIRNQNFNGSSLDGNAGLQYRYKKLKVGLGINQLFGASASITDQIGYTQVQSFFASASYRLYFDKSKNYSIEPVVLVRYAETELPSDVAVVFNIKDKLWVVPTYKSNGAYGLSAGVSLANSLKLSYAYELAASNDVAHYQSGSHEIMLGYSFDIRSKALRGIENRLTDLDLTMDDYMSEQLQRDKLQDKIQKEMKKGINKNEQEIRTIQDSLTLLNTELDQTQQDLDKLKKDLIEAGVLREGNASDFNATKGYYVVIASVNKINYNEQAMQDEFLSKGYKKIYSEKRGWHYVYKLKLNDFSESLKALKKVRETEKDDAWVFILK